MNDPTTFWLTVTNVILGLAVLLLILGIATGVLCDFVANLRRRHSLMDGMDKELWQLMHDKRRR
jgi:hypothetical protein